MSSLLTRLTLCATLVLAASCHASLNAGAGSSAAGPTGTVIVSNMNDNTAMLLDARTRTLLATLPTGRAPHEVATSHDGRWALVSNYGVRDQVGNSITVTDVDARTVARTIDLGEYRRPHGMAFLPGDTLFAVTSEASRAVLIIDFRSGRVVRRLASGGRGPHMIGLSADGTKMVGGNIADGTLAVFAPLSSDSARTIRVPAQPEGVALSPDGTHAWVGSNRDSVVTVVDLGSGSTLATLRGFGLPYRTAITPDGARAVITDPINANVRVFDARTFRELHTIAIPRDSLVPTAEVPGSPSPEGVTTSRDSRWAFVTLQGRNRFITIDLERGAIAGYGVTGTWSDGNRLFSTRTLMAADRKHEAAPTWRSVVSSAIDWEEGHASVDAAARGLAPELRGRRPDGVPHSAWELLEHIRRTQADLLDFMTNESYTAPEWPRDYWPRPNAAPSAAAWTESLQAIHADREKLKELAMRESLDLTSRIPWGDGQTYLRCLLLAVDHTSYHVGQMIIVRRLLGAWTQS